MRDTVDAATLCCLNSRLAPKMVLLSRIADARCRNCGVENAGTLWPITRPHRTIVPAGSSLQMLQLHLLSCTVLSPTKPQTSAFIEGLHHVPPRPATTLRAVTSRRVQDKNPNIKPRYPCVRTVLSWPGASGEMLVVKQILLVSALQC